MIILLEILGEVEHVQKEKCERFVELFRLNYFKSFDLKKSLFKHTLGSMCGWDLWVLVLLIIKHSNHHVNYLLILTDLNQTIHLQPTQDGNLFAKIECVGTIRILMTRQLSRENHSFEMNGPTFLARWNHNAKEMSSTMFTKPNQHLTQDERD